MSSQTVHSSILSALDNLDEVRPFNQVANRIVTACNDPETDAVDLGDIIRCDPALSLRVMHVANSSMYGAGGISTMDHAIVVMGFRSIRNLCLSVAASDLFDASAEPHADAYQDLWKHSLFCAAIASNLSDVLNVDSDEAFLAGMVHDVGKLICHQVDHDAYGQATEGLSGDAIIVKENDCFGIDHQQVGGRCAEQWGLPPEIGFAIRSHHKPEEATDCENLVKATFVADIMTHAWTDGSTTDEQLSAQLQAKDVMLTPEQCEQIRDTAETEYKELCETFDK